MLSIHALNSCSQSKHLTHALKFIGPNCFSGLTATHYHSLPLTTTHYNSLTNQAASQDTLTLTALTTTHYYSRPLTHQPGCFSGRTDTHCPHYHSLLLHPARILFGSTAPPCEFYLDLLHRAANPTWIYCTPFEFYLDLLHPPANSTWICCTPLRIRLGSTAPPCEFYLDLLHPLRIPLGSTAMRCEF